MFDFVGVGVLVLLTAVFAWLLTRAWGSKNAILKWGGLLVTGLFTLVFGLLLTVAVVGFVRLNAQHPNPVAEVTVAGTPEQLARGERLVQVCTGCHSPTGELPLAGQDFAVGGPPVGTLYAPNLTPAHLGEWTDGEIIRAIREGVGRDGRALIIMPANNFHSMSDDDVQAVVAFLRTQPAVEPDTPRKNINAIGAILVNIAPLFTNQPPITGAVVAPPVGANAEYGEYLVNMIACRDCHGANLTGGGGGLGPPPGPSLAAVPGWSEEQFVSFFRSGVRPDGTSVAPEMPWQEYDRFASDEELRAIYAYLSGLSFTEGAAQ
jgi:mono/diheme cytochrome c family protein